MTIYDACVVGVGTMGSAACYQLARRGFKVLGLEQFEFGHAFGSGHGVSRMIRFAYFESPDYVKLSHYSMKLWEELEQEAGCNGSLVHKTGSLDIGEPDSRVLNGSIQSCIENGLDHEVLSASQVRSRFPALDGVPDGFQACYQPDAGFLDPEACTRAHVSRARIHGADIRTNVKTLSYSILGNGNVELITNTGRFVAKKIILTAGAWIPNLCPSVSTIANITVERQVLVRFETEDDNQFSPSKLPIFILQHQGREFYGFPSYKKAGMKAGVFNHLFEKTLPDSMNREVTQRDIDAIRPLLSNFLPRANGRAIDSCCCLFSNTSDHHFIVDFVPRTPQIIVAGGFSGHGFKFAPVIGEIVADMFEGVEGKAARLAGGLFSLNRFTNPHSAIKNIHKLDHGNSTQREHIASML